MIKSSKLSLGEKAKSKTSLEGYVKQGSIGALQSRPETKSFDKIQEKNTDNDTIAIE